MTPILLSDPITGSFPASLEKHCIIPIKYLVSGRKGILDWRLAPLYILPAWVRESLSAEYEDSMS